MGSSPTKPEKTVDTTGTVNNNVIVSNVTGEVDVFSIEIVALLGIICILKIIEFIYFIYNRYYRRMKKRFVDQVPQRQIA